MIQIGGGVVQGQGKGQWVMCIKADNDYIGIGLVGNMSK